MKGATRIKAPKKAGKRIFKSDKHKNIEVYFDDATNTYNVYFVSDCKKPKSNPGSADLHEDAKLVLMSCPEYPCGR